MLDLKTFIHFYVLRVDKPPLVASIFITFDIGRSTNVEYKIQILSSLMYDQSTSWWGNWKWLKFNKKHQTL